MARTKRDYLIIREDGHTVDLYTGPDAERRATEGSEDGDRVFAGRGILEMQPTSIRRLLPLEPPAPARPRKVRPKKAKPAPEPETFATDED